MANEVFDVDFVIAHEIIFNHGRRNVPRWVKLHADEVRFHHWGGAFWTTYNNFTV